MKRSAAIVSSMLALASLAGSQVALAQQAPHQEQVRFECPHISGGVVSERLTNYGAYISGLGEENIEGQKTRPIFSGPTTAGVPSDLTTGHYNNVGAVYTPSTGRITCNYLSTTTFDPFHVSYLMNQGKGGFVLKSENTKITIILPTG